MSRTLVTHRLTLRHLAPGDAPAITEHMSDWQVVRMLARPPWPYSRADADGWLARARSFPWEFAIIRDDALIGVIGITGHLGYWLGQAHWGHGYMTEAATALLDAYFRKKREPLIAGVFHDNAASQKLLIRLGFRVTGQSRQFCRPRGEELDHIDMVLDRADWFERAA